MLPFAAIIIALLLFARRSYLPPEPGAPVRSRDPLNGGPMRQPDFTLTAGPTMAWPRVLAAPARRSSTTTTPPSSRRSGATERKVGQLYRTKQDILLMQGEAILGLEAAARGLVRPGRRC